MSDSAVSVSRLAELLGVFQEARRLHHGRAGSEHVLMATCSDPVVREALATVGCDMRDVQRLVTRTAASSGPLSDTGRNLTPGAGELIARAVAGFGHLDLDRSPDPRLFSMLLGLMMITLLQDEQDTAAGRIIDELGLRAHASRLAASIERNSGPSSLPTARGGSARSSVPAS